MKPIGKFLFAFALAGFVVCLAAPSRADKNVNIAGTWAINGVLGDPIFAGMSPVCKLKQDGTEIHGTCKGPNGFGTVTGAVDGKKIFLQWTHAATTENGTNSTATMKGTLGDDGFIRGTYTESAFPDAGGTFTGQKVD